MKNSEKKWYIVQRAAGKDAYAVVEAKKEGRRGGKVSGLFPKLFPSMMFQGIVSGGELKEIEVPLTAHNTDVLTRNGEDIDNYRIALMKFTELRPLGYGWKEACLSREEIYAVMPFSEADLIHKATVGNPIDDERLKAFMGAILSYGRQNARIMDYTADTILQIARKVQSVAAYEPLAENRILSLTTDERLRVLSEGVWRDKELEEMEAYIQNNIRVRLANRFPLVSIDSIRRFAASLGNLDSDQANALACLADSAPGVVTGSAGSGKTTLVKAFLDCYEASYGREGVLLVAPTGRAARRLHSSTNHDAWTIHKVLLLNPDEEERVVYDENNPLPKSLVVVDEASMVGTELMYRLLRAIRADAKIIFVGDCNQLPPVPYGQPYAEFCETLKTYRLTRNHRQDEGTDIADACQDILRDRTIKSGRGVKTCDIKLADLEHFLEKDADMEAMQYIAPTHAINDRINAFFKKGRDPFNRDDKVIFLRNTKDYCNGDIGVVLGVFGDEMVVKLIDGDIGADVVTVTKKNMKDVALAYGITVHKMQGSESNRVVAFLPKSPWGEKEAIRRMRYTALSRARKQLTVYFYSE